LAPAALQAAGSQDAHEGGESNHPAAPPGCAWSHSCALRDHPVFFWNHAMSSSKPGRTNDHASGNSRSVTSRICFRKPIRFTGSSFCSGKYRSRW